MAAEVVEFETVDFPLKYGKQGEGVFLHRKESGELRNENSGLLVSNNDEVTKGENDAAEEWSVPEQIRSFYFVKHRMYDDPVITTQIDHADKEIRKRNKFRFRLAGELKAKRARRAELITWLKSLRNEEKQYRAILSEKTKDIKPLQHALGKLRNANSTWGGEMSSSEEELNEIINGLHYRIQQESLSLAEEKQLIEEIKQLEGTRENVIANAATKAEFQDSVGHKEAIQDQLNLIGCDLDEIRNEQQATEAKIKQLDNELEAINGDVATSQEEMNSVTEKRDRAVERIRELRSQNAHDNSSFFECRRVISLAKSFALAKDIKALEDLQNEEVEKFMSEWNESKSFRDDYVKRISPSFEIRELTNDGRMIIRDDKPKMEVEVVATSSKVEMSVKVDVKRVNEQVKFTAYEDTSPIKKARKGANAKVTKFELKLDYDDVDEQIIFPEKPTKELSADVEVDEEKLKEVKREEEIAKAKQAMERKKRLAEKAAIKAALKAQKEAEKKNKEREKKAKKKGSTFVITSAEDFDETYGQGVEQENDDIKIEGVAPVQKKVQKEKENHVSQVPKENHVRHRLKQKAPESIPKAILKRRKSSNFWVWVAAVAIIAFFTLLAVLGYQSLP